MEKILAVLGMFLILGVTYLFSKNKKEINWKGIGLAFTGQLALALILIKTPAWKLVEIIASAFNWLIFQSTEGIKFVFGDLTGSGALILTALMPIVFISAIIGLLFHFGILQKFILVVGKSVAKLLGVDTLVAVNAISNMFLGQSDALFMTKSYLPNAKDSVIFATLVGGMTSISVSVMGLYSSFGANMEWIVVSLPLTVFSTFILTQLTMPTKYEEVENLVIEDDRGANFIDTMMSYASTGFKAVIGIAVALMVFISLVFMINNLIGLVFPSVTLESILGVVFTPLAWLMGVPAGEVGTVAQILATKLALNEAVAFGLPQFAMLSANTKAMVTVALCGFAGFGSIGIMIGGYTAIAPKKVPLVAKLGLKALMIATLGNLLTGAIVGLML